MNPRTPLVQWASYIDAGKLRMYLVSEAFEEYQPSIWAQITSHPFSVQGTTPSILSIAIFGGVQQYGSYGIRVQQPGTALALVRELAATIKWCAMTGLVDEWGYLRVTAQASA